MSSNISISKIIATAMIIWIMCMTGWILFVANPKIPELKVQEQQIIYISKYSVVVGKHEIEYQVAEEELDSENTANTGETAEKSIELDLLNEHADDDDNDNYDDIIYNDDVTNTNPEILKTLANFLRNNNRKRKVVFHQNDFINIFTPQVSILAGPPLFDHKPSESPSTTYIVTSDIANDAVPVPDPVPPPAIPAPTAPMKPEDDDDDESNNIGSDGEGSGHI